MTGFARVGLIALCAVGLSVACSGKTTTTGELMLAMNTDMSLPKDVDQVRVQIKVSGRVAYDDRYDVGPGDGKVKIPATLGVVAGNDAGAVVRIKVSALRNHKSRMLREVTTTVPPDRIALLRIPIQWISDGSAIDVEDDVVSACPDGQTNIAGTCQDMTVLSADLPSYAPADVFGGGAEGGGGGTCFDTLPCFAQASTAQVDLTSCTIPAQSGDLTKVNVGLTLALGDDGICNDAACYIGLDANSPAGWSFLGGASSGGQTPPGCDACPTGQRCDASGVCQPVSTEQDAGAVNPPPFDDAGARIPAPRIKPLGDPDLGDAGAAPLGGPIQLPKAVCEKLKSGRVKSVVTSFACPSKTERNPTCGPWSAIGGGTAAPPTNPIDAGPPTGPQELGSIAHATGIAIGNGFVAVVGAGDATPGAVPVGLFPQGGGKATRITIGANQPGVSQIIYAANRFYITAGSGLYWMDTSGGGANLLASGQNISGIASSTLGIAYSGMGGIFGCPSAGGTSCTPVTIVGSVGTDHLAASGQNLFWSDGQGIRDVGPHCNPQLPDSCTPMPFAPQATGTTTTSLVVDEASQFLFWVEEPSPANPAGGRILKLPLRSDLTPPIEVATNEKLAPASLTTPNKTASHGIAVYGGNVYWTTTDGVRSVSIQGGTPTTVAPSSKNALAVAVDGTGIYWANFTDGSVMKLATPSSGTQGTP